ncbi:MAG: hypothetical protein AAF711_11790 [Planctomycetota bacterium]
MGTDLIVPVYLNQRMVFDLIAMREGGLSHVTQVASASEASRKDEKAYSSQFGLGKALSSLLSVGVSSERTGQESLGSNEQRSEQRIHTPASLLYRLREQLLADGQLKQLGDESDAGVHELVEFTAELSRNPIIETLDSLASLMDFAVLFDDPKPLAGKGKGNRVQKSQNQQQVEQIKGFSEKLRAGDTVDVIADSVKLDSKALITLEIEFLNDPTMSDLVDGNFTVIGKVIRKVGQDDSISLLRKSALSMMPQKMLDQMLLLFNNLGATEGFKVPAVTQDLQGPAFQVLPVAIFA